MKYKFQTQADRILANHSGWSGIKCQTCGRQTTNAQYSYSIRYFEKPLCRWGQSLESFQEKNN